MSILNLIAHNIFSFVVILSIVVFIHEFGHYFIAKLCGVKVEEFSIGFGKELFGFNDKSGTRWKFSLLPLGGYVRMFGDKNPASVVDAEKIKTITAEEKKVSLYFQNVYKRIAIVSAGPIANFLLCILLLTVIFKMQGVTKILPIIDQVQEQSAAKEAGILVGDRILKINDEEIKDFDQVRQIVVVGGEKEMQIALQRGEKVIDVKLVPKISISKNVFGEEQKVPLIGIGASQFEYHKLGLGQAFLQANIETYNLSIAITKAIGELIIGERSVKELSGPVKIAQYSGKSMSEGLLMVLWFMAMISVNLGVANLLPIPVLDGGHLFFYIIEAIRGKALPEKVQMIGFQIGFALLLSLMIFTTYNDINNLFHN
ncbi:MAG: mmpA [Rickettsiaceae bacterium]|jgi:regulator of sigma E protease|nr:mmpA [Rickettsiaceae bacterium]